MKALTQQPISSSFNQNRFTIIKKSLIILIAIHCIFLFESKKTQAQVTVSFQVFYDELAPYGSWVYNADYGPVWVPGVNHQFYPYGSDGYWVFTSYGWTWVSLFPWGWAPFHYGRWFYDPFYRWVWVPGYQWSCAWVAWRQYEGYYGWTPIAPGVSLTFAFSNYYEPQYDHWRFVHGRYLGRRDLNQHFSGFGGYLNYLKNSHSIENIREYGPEKWKYHAGPTRMEVENNTRKKIQPIRIETVNTPVQKHQRDRLLLYIPSIKETTEFQPDPKPTRLDEWKGHPPIRQEIKRETHHPVKEIPIQEKQQIVIPEKEKPLNPVIIQQPHEPKREMDRVREKERQNLPQTQKQMEKPLPKIEQPRIKTEITKPQSVPKPIQPVTPPKVDKPIRRPNIIRQPQQEQKQTIIRQIPKQEVLKKAREKTLYDIKKMP